MPILKAPDTPNRAQQLNGNGSSLGVSINLKHDLELHEFSVHKMFPLEANSCMRIPIWDLEYRIRVISAAQILNALMNRLHPIPFIPRLRAVSYHSTLRRVCLNVAGRDSRVEVAGAGAGKGRG